MTMITATLACRQDLARWIAMSAPQSRRVGNILERAFETASELGRTLGAKERRDNPVRQDVLWRPEHRCLERTKRTSGGPTLMVASCQLQPR